ncbi:MAG: ribosomal subunit interface protein, partial [Actinomycetales bacterium]
MDIVITGRRMTVNEDLREHVTSRIKTIAKLNDRVVRVEVQFTANETKNSPGDAIEAEITIRAKGPVIRSEAVSDDKMAAFDKAF